MWIFEKVGGRHLRERETIRQPTSHERERTTGRDRNCAAHISEPLFELDQRFGSGNEPVFVDIVEMLKYGFGIIVIDLGNEEQSSAKRVRVIGSNDLC